MTAERMTRTVAGALILLSVLLASLYNGVALAQPTWIWFTIFVGLNLFQSGLTRWCLMTSILRRVGFA
jgi:hypothetical protein